MNGNAALKLAREVMDKHGLLHWKATLINSKSVAGRCRYGRWHENPRQSSGSIELSTPYLDVHGDKEIMETILHEIAHALVGPKVQAHGAEWKKMARSIGSTGARCVSADAPKIASRYTGTCVGGHQYSRHRKTRDMEWSSHYCPRCSTHAKKAYITWVDNTTGRQINLVKPEASTLRVPEPAVIRAATPAPAGKTQPKLKRPVVKSPESWKEKFDRGMTSFGDDW